MAAEPHHDCRKECVLCSSYVGFGDLSGMSNITMAPPQLHHTVDDINPALAIVRNIPEHVTALKPTIRHL